MTAASDDHTSVFYNPAALTSRGKIHLGADLYAALPSLTITPEGPVSAGFEPDGVGTHSGMSLGALFPFGGKVENRFAVGVGLHVPFGGILSAEFLDPQVPQWYRYNNLPKKLHVVVGAGYRPWRFLHVGVGAQVLASVTGGATVGLDLVNEQLPRRDVGVELVTTASPTAGVLLEPPSVEGLRVGLAYRGELGLELALPILFDLGDTLDFVVGVAGVSLYIPEQVAGGVALDLRPTAGVPLLLAVDLTWARWSQAPSPELDVAIDVQGEAVDELGFEEGLDFSTGHLPPVGFEDTFTARAGLEGFVTDAFTVRAGYGFRPSALRRPTGFTNYLDAPAHILGVGGAVTAPDPLEIDDNPVTFELAAQYVRLLEEAVDKPRGDPVGPYTFGGNVLTLSLTARHDF